MITVNLIIHLFGSKFIIEPQICKFILYKRENSNMKQAMIELLMQSSMIIGGSILASSKVEVRPLKQKI